MPKGAPPPADAPQPQMMQMPHPSQNPNFASIWTVDGSQEADFSKWYVIYPNYINADKSLHLGRRIPIEKACKCRASASFRHRVVIVSYIQAAIQYARRSPMCAGT